MATKKRFTWGYSLIVNSILAYFIYGALTTSGLNVIVPTYSAMYGWDSGLLMTLSTVGGILAVFGSLLFSQLIMTRGARLISVVTLALTGAAVVMLGNASSIVVYGICIALFQILGQGYGNIGTNTIIGNWFPVRKGFILGITTMGLPLASFAFVPLLSATFGSMGATSALTVIGIAIFIFGIISWFWLRNTPQEVGLLPDNGKYPENTAANADFKSKWIFKTLLKNKNALLIAFGYGMLFLVTQAMVSQTVPYLIEQGFAQGSAVSTLSMAAGIGIIGSFLWGVLDDRMGTKPASIIYAIWYAITFVLLFLQSSYVVTMIGIVMLGASLGGIGNLMPSMIITAFGAAEFPSVNRVINTILSLVRAMAFVVMALGLRINGTYRYAVIPLIVITVVALLLILGIDKKDAPQATAVEASK